MTVDAARDAYGQMMLAVLDGEDALEIVERNDGFISASVIGPKLYLAPFRRWPAHHRRAIRYMRGRVLDVGAGGGPMVSPDELREIVDGTGWYVAETIDSDDTYIAVIEKAG